MENEHNHTTAEKITSPKNRGLPRPRQQWMATRHRPTPPLQGDDCPPERLEEGPDPAHANWWRPWHQPLDTLGMRNSRAGGLDVRAPLKSHKLPGDGHEGQVAGHTGGKRTTGGEDTKAGATRAHGSTVHRTSRTTPGQKKGIPAWRPCRGLLQHSAKPDLWYFLFFCTYQNSCDFGFRPRILAQRNKSGLRTANLR